MRASAQRLRAQRLPALLLLALGLGACGDRAPLPEHDLWVGVTIGAQEVGVGEGFPVRVERVWSKALVPAAREDAPALPPLRLRHLATERREDARHVAETRRYRAHVFTLDDVTVPALLFAARARDGTPRVARSEPARLRVRAALDPTAPGDPELPGPLESAGFPWVRVLLLAGVALLLALAAGAWWRTRRAAGVVAVPDPKPPGPVASTLALRALARLRAGTGEAPAALQEGVVETAEILRRYVQSAWPVPAGERTSEEILAETRAVARIGRGPHGLLADALAHCDRVKFAAHAATPAGWSRLLDGAERFVRETAETIR